MTSDVTNDVHSVIISFARIVFPQQGINRVPTENMSCAIDAINNRHTNISSQR